MTNISLVLGISASGRTSSYNGGCSSIHESRTSNGNLSVASNDGVSNFRNKGHLLRKQLDDCGGNVSKGEENSRCNWDPIPPSSMRNASI